ncbi:hypothetical protein KCMC57_up57480 [Kitasatospora sp. CMC57]|uniref:DUF1876 domain-containing protein n=1 Tax=Kitasatospora sp. CMC57 TaxID=3231513 RepID=A0AB33K3M0_9ACTN
MTTHADPARTKQWALRLDLSEEGDLTEVHAVLDTGENTLESHTTAQRSPHDAPVPEIGEEFAVGRALIELGHQLLRAATTDAAANDPPLHG